MYLNSWSADWAGTTSAKQSTQDMPTLETLKRAMQEFRKKYFDRGPDVWVLTSDEVQYLKSHCEDRGLLVTQGGFASDPFSIYGIRIEECATTQEVRVRVLELADQGVKAGFIEEDE